VFNISVVPAVACAMLEDLGFQNISQALAKYDADYLAKKIPEQGRIRQLRKERAGNTICNRCRWKNNGQGKRKYVDNLKRPANTRTQRSITYGMAYTL